MGYTTDFWGSFKVDPPLNEKQTAYLKKFSETRRMKRHPNIALNLKDDDRNAAELPIGDDGEYFVGGTGLCGQDNDESVLSYNQPPAGQPGLRCRWIPNADGTEVKWDRGEKFYHYVEWIEYIVEHFLKPWGRKLNGEVHWQGEENEDIGVIYAKDNRIEAVESKITNAGPSWAKGE